MSIKNQQSIEMSFQIETPQPIDIEKQLFPFCIVWTTIPCLSWLFPFIGHTAICKSNGILYQFMGRYINSGDLSFGLPLKYVQLQYMTLPTEQYDMGINLANEHFQTQYHNLCTNNCHHHVAAALNYMRYLGRKDWTQLSVQGLLCCQSKYISWWAMFKVWLPCFVIMAIVACAIALPLALT